ncbi:MAG TPA: hypothetical protein EYP65_02410 [Armatimonadetes bacterium]|nr:hypothetical protein [Armatimonadota bacterium]
MRRGQALMVALFLLAVIMALSLLGVRAVAGAGWALHREEARLLALNAAEGGVELALSRLRADPGYRGGRIKVGRATVKVEVEPEGGAYKIRSKAKVALPGGPAVERAIEVEALISEEAFALRSWREVFEE